MRFGQHFLFPVTIYFPNILIFIICKLLSAMWQALAGLCCNIVMKNYRTLPMRKAIFAHIIDLQSWTYNFRLRTTQ